MASADRKRSVVLFTSTTYPLSHRTVDYPFYTHLPRLGYDITLVMRSTETDRVTQAELADSTVWVVPKPVPSGTLFSLVKTYWDFLRDLRQAAEAIQDTQPIDLCIGRTDPMMMRVARELARANDVPFISWISDLWPEELLIASKRGIDSSPTGSWFKGWFGKRMRDHELLAADGVIANSERMREHFTQTYDIPTSKQCVVHGGVPNEPVDESLFERAQQLREEHRLEDKRVALYVGTLALMRRPQIYVEMMPKVLKAVPNAQLLIVGDGPRGDEIEVLRQRAQELGVEEYITLTGRVTWEKTQAFIVAADVGLCALELHIVYDCSAPLKVIEYLFGRLPVVCTDVPFATALVEPAEAGRIVSFDADEFAAATAEIMSLSDRERNEMGDRGRRRVVDKTSHEKIAENLVQFLDGILD